MELKQLLQRYHIDSSEALEWQVKYNVAPSLDSPVIMEEASGLRRAVLMKWGLVPPWEKGPTYRPISNVRSETLVNRPGFKRLLETLRCLVPVDGFYEWQTEGKKKLPYRYLMRSGEIFSLGAVYTLFTTPSGKVLPTFSLITTEANKLVGKIQDRMPVIVPPTHEAAWLDPRATFSDYAMCLSPYPSDEMTAYRVSTELNSGKVDKPSLILPDASGPGRSGVPPEQPELI